MTPKQQPTNDEIASILDQIANLLEAQGANTFRARAYENAADTLRDAETPIADLVNRDDRKGLMALPAIGEGIANVIFEYVRMGRSDVLEELKAQVSPLEVLTQVPGIGDDLAHRIVEELHIHTLEELEEAAHDGRLDQLSGFGPRRLEMVRTSLAGILSGAARRHIADVVSEVEPSSAQPHEQPPIDMLLDVNAEYRRKSAADELPKIAPKRFNPQNEAWLPLLRTERSGADNQDWKFTVLYSNTALAHKLNQTHDWVVIYFSHGKGERQVTVVTENGGALDGKRVVRGREAETRRYYQEQGQIK